MQEAYVMNNEDAGSGSWIMHASLQEKTTVILNWRSNDYILLEEQMVLTLQRKGILEARAMSKFILTALLLFGSEIQFTKAKSLV